MCRSAPLIAALLAPVALWSAGAESCQVTVDAQSPKAIQRFADSMKVLCEEWYAKINTTLFGANHPLPYRVVKIHFEPKILFGPKEDPTEVPAYADKDTVHINSDYVVRTAKEMPQDYQGMFIHELTHIVQQYPESRDAGWLVEGIADYVRHKYFEKDIETKLHLDKDGKLTGYELDRNKGKFETEGYMAGYTVTGTFLFWLEGKKSQQIVPTLNQALREGHYSAPLFQQKCGAPLSGLWSEFVVQSKQ